MLKLHTLTYNLWQVNTYILEAPNKECIIIDPGCLQPFEFDNLVEFINVNQLKPKLLLNTHLHLDHVFGSNFVCEQFNLSPKAHIDDEFWIPETVNYASKMGITIEQDPPSIGEYLSDGDVIEFGGSEIRVLHVPGHSPGSVVFYCPNEELAIVGDVIFKESIGRTDLPGGDYNTLETSIKSKLYTLPDNTVLYSGHGPKTSVGYEKSNNMYVKG